MGRSVVRAGAERCHGCRLPHRWCVCGMLPPVTTPLAVDVLMHRREQWRPSSTGALVVRVVEGARRHVHRPDPRSRGAVRLPEGLLRSGHDWWILHPRGELPGAVEATAAAAPIQAILLDGNWREAGEMARLLCEAPPQIEEAPPRSIRLVRLPGAGAGRFWVRDQPAPGQVSTAEALLALLEMLGDTTAAARLRSHFELHVWATLRARGKRARADEFLASSALLGELAGPTAALERDAPR